MSKTGDKISNYSFFRQSGISANETKWLPDELIFVIKDAFQILLLEWPWLVYTLFFELLLLLWLLIFILTNAEFVVFDEGNGNNCDKWTVDDDDVWWCLFGVDGNNDDDDGCDGEDGDSNDEYGWMLWLGTIPVSL